MKPHVTMLMVGSVDGGLHPSRFTASPDGTRREWSAEYEKVHASLQADAWLVGRVTMAEMSKVAAHAPQGPWSVKRPLHLARNRTACFAVALDPAGKLHFKDGAVGGDHVIALLARDVPDSHLAELAADGVSYVVSEGADFDIPKLLDVLAEEFGIKHLVIEGGARTNGTLLAAQVVDELMVLVAPALDAGERAERIVAYPDGLAGHVRLGLESAKALDHGVVLLTYKVWPPENPIK
jgi:riboflavin biosynthesis pyrimidine reductase